MLIKKYSKKLYPFLLATLAGQNAIATQIIIPSIQKNAIYSPIYCYWVGLYRSKVLFTSSANHYDWLFCNIFIEKKVVASLVCR